MRELYEAHGFASAMAIGYRGQISMHCNQAFHVQHLAGIDPQLLRQALPMDVMAM